MHTLSSTVLVGNSYFNHNKETKQITFTKAPFTDRPLHRGNKKDLLLCFPYDSNCNRTLNRRK